MEKQIKEYKELINKLKNDIDYNETKAKIMLKYVDNDQSIDNLRLFSDTIDNDIYLFELSIAWTYFILGYNWHTAKELDEIELNVIAWIISTFEYSDEELETEQTRFEIFKYWFYSIDGDNKVPIETINE